jgi:Copper amine oxidase, enzyme domain
MFKPGYRAVRLAGALAGLMVVGCGSTDEPSLEKQEPVSQAAQAATTPPPPPPLPIICQIYNFPEVTWSICLAKGSMKGVWIASADIKRKPGDPFIRVLSQAGPAELFVPYHNNPPSRTYDMNPYAVLDPVTPSDVGPNGTVLTFPGDTQPLLAREIRDRGIAYLCKNNPYPVYNKVRRGQELVYWSVYDTGNYDYIIQYGFRDDGTITFRMGATGYNSGARPFEAHMHNVLWRINADIAGGSANNVFLDTHNEVPSPEPSLAVDTSTQVLSEAFFDWDPKTFTTLRVQDATAVNAFGQPMGYELEPLRTGSSRHFNSGPPFPTEYFTQHDFAVTRYHANELTWATGASHVPPDGYLLPQVGYTSLPPYGPPPAPPNAESVTNSDVVLWHMSAAHHDPVDEDRPNYPANPSPGKGITLVHWTGFDFVPHDFFDYNPLGGPTLCEPICGNGVCEVGEDCCSCAADCGGGISCC